MKRWLLKIVLILGLLVSANSGANAQVGFALCSNAVGLILCPATGLWIMIVAAVKAINEPGCEFGSSPDNLYDFAGYYRKTDGSIAFESVPSAFNCTGCGVVAKTGRDLNGIGECAPSNSTAWSYTDTGLVCDQGFAHYGISLSACGTYFENCANEGGTTEKCYAGSNCFGPAC